MHTVVVCDTEPIAVEGLRSLLEGVEDVRLLAAEPSLDAAWGAVQELRPAVWLIDKALGFAEVLLHLDELRCRGLKTGAIVWGATLTEAEALRFLHGGAAGAIRKTARLEALLDCLRSVARGGTWMEQDLLPRAPRPVHAHSALTSRELQVIELVEQGLKNREIAAALGIRTGTVKIHLKHIFEKTGTRSRFGLALSGLQEKGLLQIPAP